MDRFLEMQTFCAVVDAGSFVGGAEMLGFSRAAVSRYVGDLESRLGVRLLHRTTRRLSLTDEGELFYARCRELLAGVEEAEAELGSRSGAARGLLRVNVPVTFGILHLAPLWGAFRERHPQVRLDITLSDRVVDLVEEGYDLAIRIATLPSSTLISKRLATTRIVLCASPAYLERRGTPQHPSELARHAVIGYSYWSSGDEWHFDGPLRNFQPALKLVEENLCYCICDPITASSYYDYHRTELQLVFRPFDPVVPLFVSIMTPAHRPKSLLSAAFIEILESEISRLNTG